MRTLRKSLILLFLLPLLAFSESAKGNVTFVQISDPHLFDAGKKRDLKPGEDAQLDKEKRDAERLDTWAAWDWALNYVKHLDAAERLNFVVFTGDFGLEKVADKKTYPNIEYIDRKTKSAPISKKPEECWFLDDAVEEIADAFRALPVERIYVVPGNNDINDEDPEDYRFHSFIAEVNKKLNGKIIDLTLSGPVVVQGYEIVGLDSSSFKNKVPDHTPGATSGCPFSAKQIVSDRNIYQLQEIQRVKSLVHGPALLFTHIPDMDDPFCVRPGSNCPSVSSWSLSYAARQSWNDLIFDRKVRAVFAGHFHDSRRETYKRPYDWPLTRNDKAGTSLEKTYVVPPLSPKFQIDKVSGQSRGFALIKVTAKDVIRTLYWLNTLPLAGPDNIKPTPQNAEKFEIVCCMIVVIVAVVLFAVFVWIWIEAKKHKQKESTPSSGAEPQGSNTNSGASLVPDANKWAEHLFNEWKYRHDNFWHTLYRFLAAIAILVTVPFVKSEYFGPITGCRGSLVYASIPLILFCSLCFVLTHAQARLKYVERWLDQVRRGDAGIPKDPNPWGELWERRHTAFLFVFIGLSLWALWACVLLNRYAGGT